MTDKTKDLKTSDDWRQFLRDAQAESLGLSREEYEKWVSLEDVSNQQYFLKSHSEGFKDLPIKKSK